ncbi:MAG: hypothetical protein RIS70_2033 [Planctomycetota bacterium]
MEFLFELLFEFLLQILVEAMVEFGFRSVADPSKSRDRPWLAVVGYAVVGAILGGASLWFLPRHMIGNSAGRIFNLVATPFAVGMCMSGLGSWRSRRGQAVIGIDRFWYGALFAFAFAMVRFVWAT